MKFRKVKRDPLRALTSEILPYEVPLPFNTSLLYGFLRRLRFSWLNERHFRVLTSRFFEADKHWLEIIFDNMKLNVHSQDGQYTVYTVSSKKNLNKNLLRHPFKYWARRNNGKNRNLAVPHPLSMLTMTCFISKYRDSIIYFTNRSRFSIRHPYQVARLHAKKDTEFFQRKDREAFGVEQYDLEYEHVSSFFSYRSYNNINRFYSSSEFQACERKYPWLIRADISKCFDSIYTHTISWVTNGIRASKEQRRGTGETFGGQFDKYIQYLNYGETSGIVIGPEFSRIFAEIILQEVDVRVERELADLQLLCGRDYEIMRYVDDYFIFLADTKHGNKIDEILSKHLADFKLYLNDHKQREFRTPLKSEMSIAKLKIKEQIKARTSCEVDLESDDPSADLFFQSRNAILDYKTILIDTGLEHGELANSYLYGLERRLSNSTKKYREYIEVINESTDAKKLEVAHNALLRYLIANIEVAVFIYAGAPSVSHAVKLTRLIVSSLKELQDNNLGLLKISAFRDKVSREIEAQLAAVEDESAFGVHTLLLVDCLIFLNPEISEAVLRKILKRRRVKVSDLDAFGVLTFLRRFAGTDESSQLRSILLDRAKELISLGNGNQKYGAERVILKLSIIAMPGLSLEEVAETTGLDLDVAKQLQNSKVKPSLFSWNASDNYQERLQLKIAQMVY